MPIIGPSCNITGLGMFVPWPPAGVPAQVGSLEATHRLDFLPMSKCQYQPATNFLVVVKEFVCFSLINKDK